MNTHSHPLLRTAKAIGRFLPAPVHRYIRNTILHRGQRRIDAYLQAQEPEKKCIVFGGHWSDHPGWLTLGELDQDITKPLTFPDGSVDCVFTEHVMEHISFVDAIHFMSEAYRILKPGGIMRTVCPGFDRIINFNFSDGNPLTETYFEQLIVGPSRESDQLVRDLGLQGLREEPRLFYINNLFTMHGHRFIWSESMMKKVMEAIGFRDVRAEKPGHGRVKEYCIERKQRGIYLGRDWQEDAANEPAFDAESIVVEGVKMR